jgi:hypothetical protein
VSINTNNIGDTCGFAHPEWAKNTKKSAYQDNGENEVEQVSLS